MNPDDQAWLQQLRRRIDDAKCCAESNHRLPTSELVTLASDLESIYKRARALLEMETA